VATTGNLTPEDQVELQTLRSLLSQLLIHFQTRLQSSTVFSVSDDLTRALSEFQQTHQRVMQMEKQIYVERRCEVIRWCAWCACQHGKNWLEHVDINVLHNGFSEWLLRPSKPLVLQPSVPKMKQPDSPIVKK
jgi:hypothetical protein